MVEKTIGRNRNTTDTTTVNAGVTLNTSTSTTIAAANPDRIFICINNNDSSNGSWIKMQAASVDNIKKGIFLTSKVGSRNNFFMPSDNIYTGEISAIADAGIPTVYVTEY